MGSTKPYKALLYPPEGVIRGRWDCPSIDGDMECVFKRRGPSQTWPHCVRDDRRATSAGESRWRRGGVVALPIGVWRVKSNRRDGHWLGFA